MMKIMALQVLREVAQNIQSADFCFLMGDEVTDVSNVLQLAICLRWVDCDLVAHDEKHVLLRMNLKLNNCRGQCYE